MELFVEYAQWFFLGSCLSSNLIFSAMLTKGTKYRPLSIFFGTFITPIAVVLIISVFEKAGKLD